jgi:hypothetical protein
MRKGVLANFFRHYEPFALCHSERGEKSTIIQGKRRVAISLCCPTTEITSSLYSWQ